MLSIFDLTLVFGAVSYSSVKEEEPDKPAYDGPFVAEAIVEMPYKPSPYDTESLALEVSGEEKSSCN